MELSARLNAMKYEDEKYYHVYNRGANKQDIFLCASNYDFCLRLFKKFAFQYYVSIMTYCLMPNHYHLLLRQCDSGSISSFIQAVFNSYSQAFNKATGHSGTLFQGRAKGMEVINDEYAVRLCRYIHYNPVAARLVTRPEDWQYSDYLDWIGKRNGTLTDLSLRETYFESADAYRSFMDEYRGNEKILNFDFE